MNCPHCDKQLPFEVLEEEKVDELLRKIRAQYWQEQQRSPTCTEEAKSLCQHFLVPRQVTVGELEKVMHTEHYRQFHLMSPEIAKLLKNCAQAIRQAIYGQKQG